MGLSKCVGTFRIVIHEGGMAACARTNVDSCGLCFSVGGCGEYFGGVYELMWYKRSGMRVASGWGLGTIRA